VHLKLSPGGSPQKGGSPSDNFAVTFRIHATILNAPGFMFAILIIALMVSLFLFWQSFKNPAIAGTQKIIGLICASLPVLWVLLFIKQFI
jgi:hypothetical protein